MTCVCQQTANPGHFHAKPGSPTRGQTPAPTGTDPSTHGDRPQSTRGQTPGRGQNACKFGSFIFLSLIFLSPFAATWGSPNPGTDPENLSGTWHYIWRCFLPANRTVRGRTVRGHGMGYSRFCLASKCMNMPCPRGVSCVPCALSHHIIAMFTGGLPPHPQPFSPSCAGGEGSPRLLDFVHRCVCYVPRECGARGRCPGTWHGSAVPGDMALHPALPFASKPQPRGHSPGDLSPGDMACSRF